MKKTRSAFVKIQRRSILLSSTGNPLGGAAAPPFISSRGAFTSTSTCSSEALHRTTATEPTGDWGVEKMVVRAPRCAGADCV
ncbi:unnamed protein product, partial [Iphiclides podalirius]